MAALTDYMNLLNPTSGSPVAGDTPVSIDPITPREPKVGIDPIAPRDPRATPGPGPGYQPTSPAMLQFNPQVAPAGAPTNWQSIIAGNPDYMAWSLSAGERADTAASQRRAALKALATRFGIMPENFQDVYGDIDPATAQIARDNPVSEHARLLQAYNDSVEQNKRHLAARGMLQSGELGYTGNQLDFQNAQNEYDLNNQFLDASQGAINDYAGVLAGLSAEQIQQIQAAAQAAYDTGLYGGDYGGGGGGDPTGPTAPPPPDTTPPVTQGVAAPSTRRVSPGGGLYVKTM